MRELYRGLSGADVQRWGRFLIREGHLPNWRGRTFDAELEAATRSFQRGSQLEASGRADGNTLAAALAEGLLDPHLDDPADHSAPALKGTALTILIPIVVALIVGIFGGIGALVNWQSNIDVEREKLKSSIILQASNSTDRNQVISNLSFFKRLEFIDVEDEILIGYTR